MGVADSRNSYNYYNSHDPVQEQAAARRFVNNCVAIPDQVIGFPKI